MWVPRTPEETAAAIRKDYLFQFGFGLLLGSIGGIFAAYGYNKWTGSLAPAPVAIGTLVCYVLIFGLLTGILFALFQASGKTWICTSCENMKKTYGSSNCSCGGIFQDIRKVKWVEDKKKEEPEGK